MAKRKEVINGLHNVFTLNSDDLYDISSFSYEQSVDENTILFAIADSEDVGNYITINGEPKIISENDNFIITDGIVFSGNGGGSGNSGGNSGDNNGGVSGDNYMLRYGSNYTGSSSLVNHSISPQWTIKNQSGTPVDSTQDKMSIEVEYGAKVDFSGEWSYEAEIATTKEPTACSGNWGDALPNPGNVVTFSESNIERTTSFSQTISGPKSGLEVKNGKVVVASGSDTDTKTASVTFKHRIYYGASTLSSISNLEDLKRLNTEFSDTFAKTFTANCTGGKYIYLAYPSAIPGNPVFNVGGFDSSEIIESNRKITNDYDSDIDYKVLRILNKQNGSSITVKVTKK